MKILVADDHILFLSGLKLTLMDFDPKAKIDSADSYDGLLEKAAKQPFDLILMDIAMPGGPFSSALVQLRSLQPDALVVLLSAITDHKLIREAFQMGVKGFIPKTSPASLLLSALKLIQNGGTYLPPEILEAEETMKTASDLVSDVLTPRQRDVLKFVCLGKSNKEIALLLNLSEGTVKLHVTAILKALGVSNRTEAVIKVGAL